MKAVLLRDWFYEGRLFERRDYQGDPIGVVIPDELKPHLPKDAKIVDEADYKPKVKEDILTTLSDFDNERAETDIDTAFKGKSKKK